MKVVLEINGKTGVGNKGSERRPPKWRGVALPRRKTLGRNHGFSEAI